MVLISESSFIDHAVSGKELDALKDESGMCRNDCLNFSLIGRGTNNMINVFYVFNVFNVFNMFNMFNVLMCFMCFMCFMCLMCLICLMCLNNVLML